MLFRVLGIKIVKVLSLILSDKSRTVSITWYNLVPVILCYFTSNVKCIRERLFQWMKNVDISYAWGLDINSKIAAFRCNLGTMAQNKI